MMTQDDIIRMAREAGFNTDHDLICIEGWEISPYMQRFAELVAAHQREQDAQLVKEMVEKNYDLDDFANSVLAGMMRLCSDGRPKWLKVSMEVAAEREACALILDKVIEHLYIHDYDGDASTELRKCAKTIRARSDYDPRPPR